MLPLAIGAIVELMSTLQLGIGSGKELYETIRRFAPAADPYPELSDAELIGLFKMRAERGKARWEAELAALPPAEET